MNAELYTSLQAELAFESPAVKLFSDTRRQGLPAPLRRTHLSSTCQLLESLLPSSPQWAVAPAVKP